MNKLDIYILGIVIALAALILFVFPIPKEYDFYNFHVQECLEAHAHNMTFLICSGFWKEPEPEDIENSWAVHPSEDPYTQIAHGSCLGSYEITYGVIGYLLTDTTV